MRLRIERDLFADAVAWVARSLPHRPAVPVLGGVLVEATGGRLRLSASDHEVCAQAAVDAEVSESGSVLLPGRLLAEIARGLPAEPVELRTDAAHVVLIGGGFE